MQRTANSSADFRNLRRGAIGLCALVTLALCSKAAQAQPARLIWSPKHSVGQVPKGDCHFRKSFQVAAPEGGTVLIMADDQYELFVNGRKAATGGGELSFTTHDISQHLARGHNVISVKVHNTSDGMGGLALKAKIRHRGGEMVVVSDKTWKTRLKPFLLWTQKFYDDRSWPAAQEFGIFGGDTEAPTLADSDTDTTPDVATAPAETPTPEVTVTPGTEATPVADSTPAAEEPQTAASETKQPAAAQAPPEVLTEPAAQRPAAEQPATLPAPAAKVIAEEKAPAPVVNNLSSTGRFKISREFEIENLVPPAKTGSLISMTFNEFGQIVAGRENGPLLLIYDANKDGKFDRVSVYCDQVKNCQGILALNGDVFVTADGPQGAALYHLSDGDRDGKLEKVKPLVKFKGQMGEHGPHGLRLGGDGLIYVVVGNHTQPLKDYAPSSPYRNYYEGDLFRPRYEDPLGHGVGVKAPGGTVIRTDIQGNFIELVAGGLRNAYDLLLDAQGEIFIHDSDMEWDQGSTWYRPTRLTHVTPGGEYGWRSGNAKWPKYFFDSLPPTLETGRGSPSGGCVYNHVMFPARYHNALFLCDWSEGKILAVRLGKQGATYQVTSETFLTGEPLNATDIEVGPDGGLYFVTGGRGTEGGIYRVTWRGTVPESIRNPGEGIAAVIRQPQPSSSWARQQIAVKKKQLGSRWKSLLISVAKNPGNPDIYRARALDVLQLFGPQPSPELLLDLSTDEMTGLRAKTAVLMGLQPTEKTNLRLVGMLSDSDPWVRRKACESLIRAGVSPSFEALEPLLTSADRFEAFAARRLLERVPGEAWHQKVLTTDDHRLFIQGAAAMLIAKPTKENARAVIARTRELMKSFVNDPNFIDMLRLTQIAIIRGELKPAELDELAGEMAEEFPSANHRMNREIVRLVAFLQGESAMGRMIEHLKSDAPEKEKGHVALHLRYLNEGWTKERKLALLKYYEKMRTSESGASFPRYVENYAKDFAKNLTSEEAEHILAEGATSPTAALAALYRLPKQPSTDTLAKLISLDRQIAGRSGEAYERLSVGIIAVLSRAGTDEAMTYLREAYREQPSRRATLAMGLAQKPEGDNWPLLVKAIPLLDNGPAQMVMAKLATVDKQPESPEAIRQVIIKGLELKAPAAKQTIALLRHWTGEEASTDGQSWDQALTAWQAWFAARHPGRPAAKLPELPEQAQHSYEQLLKLVSQQSEATASPSRGELVYRKAQCAKCHRAGTVGNGLGPDLTGVTKRFHPKEILDAILFPSHVISDQYATRTVITLDGRKLSGMVVGGAAGEVKLLQADGTQVSLRSDEIQRAIPSKQSIMPAGLLDTLSEQEIADLFAFLRSPGAVSATAEKPGQPVR